MKDIFPHANTIVAMRSDTLLKKEQFDALYKAQNITQALNELNDADYFGKYVNATAENYPQLLNDALKDNIELLKEISPKEELFLIFALYYDIHNMKIAVKERFLNKSLSNLFLPYGNYDMRDIRSALVGEQYDILKNKVLSKGVIKARDSKEMYDIDFILDKLYFDVMYDYAVKLKNDFIIDFTKNRADLYNFSLYFQMQIIGSSADIFDKAFSDVGSLQLEDWKKYISGAEDDSFIIWSEYKEIWKQAQQDQSYAEMLDTVVDNYLIEKLKSAKLMAFGYEPIFAYFFSKFIEIKNVRILLTGKLKNYDVEEIKKRMRIRYEL